MTNSNILVGLPQGMIADVLIPWESALQVVVPLIKANDPIRVTAIPMFEAWVKSRDTDLSVEQAAWLWDNFCAQFARESNKRVSQWAHDPENKATMNPFKQGSAQMRIWTEMHFKPWKARMQSTVLGRLTYKLIEGLSMAAFFFMSLLLVNYADVLFAKAKGTATMMLMLLGVM